MTVLIIDSRVGYLYRGLTSQVCKRDYTRDQKAFEGLTGTLIGRLMDSRCRRVQISDLIAVGQRNSPATSPA